MKFLKNLLFWISCPRTTTTPIDKMRWNCAKEIDLGVDEVPEWQDWSNRETTPDQKRIESLLATQDLIGKSLLHVGIGNSEFAQCFQPKAGAIDGITIQGAELTKGQDLGIPGYRVFLLNKFSAEMPLVLGARYDFIIDNNPSAFACCRSHFFTMMRSYYKLLNPDGIILTDKLGLGWSTQPNSPAWGLSPENWFEIGNKFDFKPIQYDDWVIGLQKSS